MSDERVRCFGGGDPLYRDYHDSEWGRPVTDDRHVLERVCLEGFQSGLSWLTILRKREGFRAAFAGFDPSVLARFGPVDIDRLMADAGIVRNRAKIEATIANARATLALEEAGDSLAALMWAHAPAAERPAPASFDDVAATTPESAALSKALKVRGFRFIGPTTAYAAMQACGVVNDHLAGCWVRADVEEARTAAVRASTLGV